MKTLFKITLIWSTILGTIIVLTGIDSIIEQEKSLIYILSDVLLILICYKTITKEDFYIYSGCKFINNLDSYYEENDNW